MKLAASICLLVVLALSNEAQADRLKCKYYKINNKYNLTCGDAANVETKQNTSEKTNKFRRNLLSCRG